ncbi:SDR family NAD(P)-dependent oxidoreductase, partial [Nocardia farcinica]|uniref:SDR family NAD(P)-dependent oxidoreductase n=1 Tax=Nocardia farcinica TaxID=37329 RepID=UPI0024575D8E
MGRLEGKVALITGVADGQGRAAAILFAREGATIAGCDINEKGAAETARLVQVEGGVADCRVVDLGDPDACTAWVDEIAELFGGIDILYNNAGATKMGPFATTSLEDYRFTMRNALDLVVFPTRAAGGDVVAPGGGGLMNHGTKHNQPGDAVVQFARPGDAVEAMVFHPQPVEDVAALAEPAAALVRLEHDAHP